ncbi:MULTISPECIES: ArsR family transcriptional regulator [unclassified Halorhabdus]|uniref:winged helix-turn-helix transcriptional regulator n=1 Tax=unclassified Halorhabdus TaxID=2621901 RepID=UPI0023DB3104|nr:MULTISPECIES: ArsR family transcriptional regulator [unclassified Halorhabdus]WEL17836.1 Putative transcriptional regulator [Halorhabdus sp. SVX81]WEL21712.1 Putative transcriptional regulator, containd twoHTH domains [Halorhabdus sp. BNX81]
MAGDGVDESKRATLRRFAALGAASPLVRLADSGSDSTAPGAIVGYLSTTPGAHFSKLRDDLQLGTGETQHHLRALLQDNTIESQRDGEYRRFFPADRFSEFERTALGYLRRDTSRGMIIELLRDPSATANELAERLDVSNPTVSKHATQLEEAGLLTREDGYALRHPETLLMLVVRYAESFGEDAIVFAAEADEYVAYDG